MSGKITITFSAPGVHPPVYVVTSLSNPPWTVLDMHPAGEGIFSRTFEDAPVGSHQYKVRIGEGHWVVDERQEITTDESGNQNNIIHVTEGTAGDDDDTIVNDSDDAASEVDVKNDAGLPDSGLPLVPVPFTVVDRVADQQQPEYGDTNSKTLAKNADKRAADAEPDVEVTAPASPHPTSRPPSPIVPDIVVEKVDDKPVHGDDFGPEATASQKLAHEQRAADPEPDKTVITSDEGHVEPGTPEEQAAPLFPHEQHEQPQEEPPTPSLRRTSTEPLDIIEEEESTQGSSADSSHQQDDDDDDDDDEDGDDDGENELEQGPRLDHELSASGFDSSMSDGQLSAQNDTFDKEFEDNVEGGPNELQNAPTFGYERMGGAESSTARRFSYERTSDASSVHSSQFAVGEHAPILPHESMNGGDESNAPLLPHEYPLGVPTPESSDGYSFNGGSFTENAHGSFNYGVDFGTPSYPERRSSSLLLRTGTNSSLPHALPRSDDVDPNLNDPSLQQFPTDRQAILERVGTIRTQLAQDETIESPANSPFAMSQACSSVDLPSNLPSAELGPVTSQASLNAVIEEDDDIGDDIGSLPSPEEDAHTLQMRQYGGCPGPVDRLGNPTTRSSTLLQQSSDANAGPSIQKIDGAQDGPRAWSDLYESVATPTRLLTSFTAPTNSEMRSWVTEVPSDTGSGPPPTDSSGRTRMIARESSDSLAIHPSERMVYRRFEVNRNYPYMGNQPYDNRQAPTNPIHKAMHGFVASIEWFCGCCGLCGPQSRAAQGIMAFVVVGVAYYAYGFLHR